jgi:hypothetical protein
MRGFVVQARYRVRSGAPLVEIFGRLEDGRPFVARDDRETPFFYTDDRGAAAIENETAVLGVEECTHRSLSGGASHSGS